MVDFLNTVQYTVSQGGLQNVTHSDTQIISAQGNVLKPVQPSGRHYVSLPTDTQSHSAAYYQSHFPFVYLHQAFV
jgi:hypothetical protein